jgi:NADPH:quinone reductase
MPAPPGIPSFLPTRPGCHAQPSLSRALGASSSSYGTLAAALWAVDAGVRVIATTRGRERVALLERLGAERVETEGSELSQRIAEAKQLDAVLDLVGNSTILDSLAMLRRGGRACLAGWLGGLAPIKDFNPLLQMAT